MTFSYAEFTTRNLGFITAEEQERLRRARIFIPGVGGMGGAAIFCLARCGVERFLFADMDEFEVSNLNRQMGSFLDTVGRPKAEVTAEMLHKINPQISTQTFGQEWVDQIPSILEQVDVVVNGCDDVKATLSLMRAAKKAGRTVIDAFGSPLPNVFVVSPDDPRPEEFFDFPSQGLAVEQLTDEILLGCFQKEVEYVLSHTSSAQHIDMELVAEVAAGTRKRMSFAPMVWTTGCFMAYEAVRVLLGRPGGPGPGGKFFNPWDWCVE